MLERHPEWSLLALSVLAWTWLGLAWSSGGGHAGLGHLGMGSPLMDHLGIDHPGMGHPGMNHPADLASRLSVWILMCAAMMVPSTIPAARHVAFAVRRQRRQRAIACFVFGYLLAWLACGLIVYRAEVLLQVVPVAVGPLAYAAAAVWELGPGKRFGLSGCHRSWPVRFDGVRSDRSALLFGWRHGSACLLVGAPMMVALMQSGHPPQLVVAVTAVTLAQKGLRRAAEWRPLVGAGLMTVAVGATLW